MIIASNEFYGGNLYRSGAFEDKYYSNKWIKNKYYTITGAYLLCNYMGTKDYLVIEGAKSNRLSTEKKYRNLTGDTTTKIYYCESIDLESRCQKVINRYLRKHKY